MAECAEVKGTITGGWIGFCANHGLLMYECKIKQLKTDKKAASQSAIACSKHLEAANKKLARIQILLTAPESLDDDMMALQIIRKMLGIYGGKIR